MKKIICGAVRMLALALALLSISIGWPMWSMSVLCIVSSFVWGVTSIIEEW